MSKEDSRAAIAEGIGTFMLVLVGAGTVALNPGNVIAAALAHGLILIAIISTYGHFSGAHVNPGVSFGLFIGGKLEARQLGIYWLAQFIGGLVAAGVLRIVLAQYDDTILNSLGKTVPAADINALGIVLVEGILTFILVSTVYQVGVFGKGGNLAPLLIGFTLAACILLGAPMTGGSVNPARTLGPALLAKEGQNLIEVGNYFLGMFLGAAVAGLIHNDTFATEDDDDPKSKRRSKKR